MNEVAERTEQRVQSSEQAMGAMKTAAQRPRATLIKIAFVALALGIVATWIAFLMWLAMRAIRI
jgi:hypothetical protein